MHYHLIGENKTSLGIAKGEQHIHQMVTGMYNGKSTSASPDTAGHTHTTPDGVITGLPIEIDVEAFNDAQKEVAHVLGNTPGDVYPMSFEDKDSKK